MLSFASVIPTLRSTCCSSSEAYACKIYDDSTLQSNIPVINLAGSEFTCLKNDSGHPSILCKKQEKETLYTHLNALLSDFTRIYRHVKKEGEFALSLATLANFLASGEEYQIITDPEQFKKDYAELLEKSENSTNLNAPLIWEYGKFDLKEISLPRLEGNKLIFYVKKKIPFRALVCHLNTPEASTVKYEILKNYSQ